VAKTLHDSFKEAMKDPDFIRTSSLMDNPILYRNSQDLGSHLVKMNEEIGSIVRTLGLQGK
jgi:tripartite-type tricarboxylate transporter receptor subunit TctC